MNDLQVECYDTKEVEAKKQSIKKRLAITGTVIAISTGLFFSCGGNGGWYCSFTIPCGNPSCYCAGQVPIEDETENSDDIDS